MKLLVLLASVVVLAVVVDHEWLRYKECLKQCEKERHEDSNLLVTYCAGRHARVATCQEAERRTLLSVTECARNRWRATSEWARAINKFIDSYWSMYMVVVPLIGWLMWLYFAERSETRFYTKQSEFVKGLLEGPNPFQKKKRKRPRIDYDADWSQA